MNDLLAQKLYSCAPKLFGDRNGDMTHTAMCWGFDCGDGWYKLLRNLALKLEVLIETAIAKDPESYRLGFYRASQVKEKYGTLRFYLSGGTDQMYNLIYATCDQSSTTCEQCGKKGKFREKHGWFYTRCNECWKQEFK